MAADPASLSPETRSAVADSELDSLFSNFAGRPAVLLAVSGGPDSTALLHLAVRWRMRYPGSQRLFAATVDHGLRPASAEEAADVARLAAQLKVPHRTLRWQGEKPDRGLQEAAREARYKLLAAEARRVGAPALALAHTRDDQAETVLFRMARGSGLAGLAGMSSETARSGLTLLRPFLDLPKARLVATLDAAGIAYASDPSNVDARFARPRLRALAPALEREGLDARGLARLARRLARADSALEAVTDRVEAELVTVEKSYAAIAAAPFAALPEEIALRLLGRCVAAQGREGPVELAKLEALLAALLAALALPAAPFRRTLAGASVTIRRGRVLVSTAPPRRPIGSIATNSSAQKAPVLGKTGPRT
ncbi:tRNA lysidine(34) synthetase TilS [Xanthobacter autotrophicus]|uniref:tRNA lysidine(34) synthetase TilS n=1 Tax=Xanthobacter autotrophicus TaxID=280 RepID=UPI001E359E88|nr:tRNA lysidine(34) synthetase TilS [Xanthobacter autotrophicus]UDQ87293.1 tRNA lysidine(34) synthetase TilS [Xanthobacter autotrophicus]